MSAVNDKYTELGGTGGFLGLPLISEMPTPDGVGIFQHYQFGSIYWTPSTGAHEVHGAIRARWESLGRELSVLGYPLTDETITTDGVGRFSEFQKGSIYWHPSIGAFEVHGGIGSLWSSLGRELSVLGYPRTGEQDSIQPGGRFNDFQHGSIYWHPSTDAYEVFEPEHPILLPAESGGEWTRITPSEEVVGMHAAVIPNENGSILLWSYDHHDTPPPGTDTVVFGFSAVWSPSARRMLSTTYTGQGGDHRMINIFCAGQAFMADGRLIVIGGDRVDATHMCATHIFNPTGRNWTYIKDTAFGRWYCTAVCLNDGRILAIGGEKREIASDPVNATYEVFNPTTNLYDPPQPAPIIHGGAPYPFVFVLPNRHLFVHAGQQTQLLNLETNAWEPSISTSAMNRTYNVEGTAVLLPLEPDASGFYHSRILMIGGGGLPQEIRRPATDTCEIFDADAPGLGWHNVASTNRRRVMPDSVLLPDGTVLVMNGSSTGFADAGANPVFAVEIYNPKLDTWTLVNSMSVPRLYHAVAVLMPDGSVVTAGTDASWNPGPFHRHEFSLEVYRPPYLFISDPPVINNAPATVSYGSMFSIDITATRTIVNACLIRCSSVTHSFNSDQRYVGLQIHNVTEGACDEVFEPLPGFPTEPNRRCINLIAPPDGFVAPPGIYMLFIRDEGGATSVAKFIHILII